MKIIIKLMGLVALLLVVGGITFLMQKPRDVVGSVASGDGYVATTTPTAVNSTGQGGIVLLRNGFGMLGSVVVSGSRTGSFFLYNATTSDVNKRTGNQSTTTLLIAEIPPSVTAGTYVYDVDFGHGLLFVGTGSVPTTTITWK